MVPTKAGTVFLFYVGVAKIATYNIKKANRHPQEQKQAPYRVRYNRSKCECVIR
jgi:hypothetical protein